MQSICYILSLLEDVLEMYNSREAIYFDCHQLPQIEKYTPCQKLVKRS